MEFTALANCTHIEPLEALLDCFISGLKPDIRRDVVSQCPTTLLRAVALTKLYEEKYTTNFKPNLSPNTTKTPFIPTITNYSNQNSPKSSLPPLLPSPLNKPPLNLRNN